MCPGVEESSELFGQNKDPWIQTNNNPSLFRNAKAGSGGEVNGNINLFLYSHTPLYDIWLCCYICYLTMKRSCIGFYMSEHKCVLCIGVQVLRIMIRKRLKAGYDCTYKIESQLDKICL